MHNIKRVNWPGGLSFVAGCWLLAALLVLGVVGNMLQLSVLFNVYFVFGSIAVMLAIAWLGTLPAILVGLVSGLYTYIIWENPVTIFVFVLEAIVVSLLYQYKIKNLIVSSLLFWLFVAAPVDFIFFLIC